YMFDTFGEGTPNWIFSGMGDLVDEIAISDDGSLLAAVTWGDLANLKADIYIFERNSNTPVFSVNTPGSMFSLSMSADGKSVAAGGKAVHARQFGNGGNVYNIGVDLGGGAIAGQATAVPSLGGVLVEVIGTTRKATTDSLDRYVVPNVPPGTYSVKFSKRGYVGTTVNNVVVTGTDTTRNINATLSQTGAGPTNLVASHSLNSRIQLNWTNPTEPGDRVFDRLLATDDVRTERSSVSLLNQRSSIHQSTYPSLNGGHAMSTLVPPDSIKIYRAVRSGGPYYLKRILAGAPSSYVDSAALPLKDYYYRVTAIYGQGESQYSNEAYGTVDSSFLQFSITTPHRSVTPTIDGTLAPGEWTDALRVDVSDVFGYGGGTLLPRGSTFMWFKYDSLAKRLYIAGEDFLNNDGLANSEGFGLYFDDNNNNQFEAIGNNPLLREGNYWGYYFSSGSTVRFREIYTGGGVNAIVDTVTDAQVAFSNATGHVTGEISIPLSFFDRNHLQVYGPNKIVGGGLFMIGRTG
ncbi:MAG: carboxypeptidase-like regulatory domain-containing protein, partial [Bacteroidota bacterium]